MRFIKKIVVALIDWFLYTFLNTKQKEFLSNLFTERQKQLVKRIIKPGKKQAQLRKVERIKYKLYTLGFNKQGLEELQSILNETNDPYLKRLTAWELTLWHSNQYSKADAEKALHFLPMAINGVNDKDFIRKATILKAESYQLLGEMEEAKRVIRHALASQWHADLYLAAANLEEDHTSRVEWINQAFRLLDASPITLDERAEKTPYDRMKVDQVLSPVSNAEDKKVTVIMPVYNAEDVIQTSLESMLNQTWDNLEILVVDDCSSDSTRDIVEQYAAKDTRVTLLQTERNSGPYVARNTALNVATGDFITINDADDWSHPEKIRTQVEHLINNPRIMGNFSQQARAMENLTFFRRGKPGQYIFSNMSSFMFRTDPVLDKLGYWDCVRFAGDSEFVKRVKRIFGEKSVAELPTAPLSFQRQSADSLTGDSVFGFPGFFFGVRKEYAEAHEHYHEQHEDNLKYEFPQKIRPFPVPEPMWPQREDKLDGSRHFDVIIASEFRLLGGTNMSNIEEIKAQKQMGLKTGLIQMNRYDLNSAEKVNPKVRDLLDGDRVQMVVYGEKVTCDVLIVRHPPILETWQKYIPNVEAEDVRVIVNQPPKREYSSDGERLYDIRHCVNHLNEYVGKTGTWYPIGPRIRKTLLEHHREELAYIDMADEDWVNIIDVKEWRRKERPHNDKIRIGRHSRDQYVKWPSDKSELLTIYPDDPNYDIHILGGAKAPKKIVGDLPANWHVYEFGEIDPKDFLATLDVFVYYTHPDWVEAFGRVIFEAMAVGVPVIIPPGYGELFGEAAIYAEPHEVQSKINWLMRDEEAYNKQVEKAQVYVEKHFGYTKHASRLGVNHREG